MASGLPDYSNVVRPAYGGGQRLASSKTVTASDDTTLLTITGKGMVYGGYILLDHTASQVNSIPVLAADGKKICSIKFDTLNKYNMVSPGKYPVFLTKFDNVNFIYGVAFSYGITFETEIAMNYIEAHGATPVVNYSLIYTLM